MNASELLPAQFNVATWFVDRNVAEGHGAAPAFRYENRTLTYADVQDLVNRTGNALLDLGLEAEQRVLMACLDKREFIGTFWGAIKIGVGILALRKDRRSAGVEAGYGRLVTCVVCLIVRRNANLYRRC